MPAAAIDPVYFAKTYYVGPREGGEDAYRRCRRARGDRPRRDRAHDLPRPRVPRAVRALDDVLALHPLRFADEVVGEDELELARARPRARQREVTMARLLWIAGDDFTPTTTRTATGSASWR